MYMTLKVRKKNKKSKNKKNVALKKCMYSPFFFFLLIVLKIKTPRRQLYLLVSRTKQKNHVTQRTLYLNFEINKRT